MSKKVLGRGLGAFFPEYQGEGDSKISSTSDKPDQKETPTAVPMDPAKRVNVVLQVPVDHIRANPDQPRREFAPDRLEELADSIRLHGIIQPVTVRYLGEKRFELISGERRHRASKMAGLAEIPAYVREVEDKDILTLALIENIQREDLNPLEVAMGYQRLMDEMEYTQAEVADQVGKNRSTVANMMRLLQLPDFLQAGLRDEVIRTGHARALLNVKSEKDQRALFDQIAREDLSVREVEARVRSLEKKREQKRQAPEPAPDPVMEDIQRRLQQRFSTKVDVKTRKDGGEIRIAWYTEDDLDRLLQLFDQIQ
ncbi:MAG: ParB/RepB/Spo0J family partition protein [Balneolaceae bacterium]